jgi:hypothetical protein
VAAAAAAGVFGALGRARSGLRLKPRWSWLLAGLLAPAALVFVVVAALHGAAAAAVSVLLLFLMCPWIPAISSIATLVLCSDLR